MKKLMLVAICAMAVMISCKQKGQTAPADNSDSLAAAAVIDSIIEENDTTPLPMFLIGNDGKYMQMLYWTNIEEPQRSEDNEDYFEAWHKRWELQDMFRRNAAQYTNMMGGSGIVKVKLVDEVLKDPDGNTPSIGEIHGREGIPSLCARFDYADAKPKAQKDDESYGSDWGMVIVTDSYLNTRKRLDVKSCRDDSYEYPKLPAEIVKQLETQYGMKAEKSHKTCIIGDRYTVGAIEFKGEYKDAPKDKYDAERKFALALEVLIDGDKLYVLEQLGHYDPEYGSVWNADADGYIPNEIEVAFEGPKGLELCYSHGAPESFCVGMLFPREDKLIELEYECYHSMVDEEIPVWKKDFAEMEKLYHADEFSDSHVKFTKWAHCYIDYDNEWIWLRDADEKDGSFFIRKDGKISLVAIENPRLRPSSCQKDGFSYLKFEGSAGGPSWQREIHVFKNGKRIEKFNSLEIEGEIDECSLNGKPLSKEEGRAYLNKIPEGQKITAWFRDIESKD